MNDKDLRDCFAMFAMQKMMEYMVGAKPYTEIAKECYDMADAMLEARNAEPETEVGIVAAKSRRKK
jgi:hypothetical protein